MIYRRKSAIAGMVLLFFSATSFAGDKDGLTTTLEDKCIAGELWAVTVWWFWGHRLFDVQTFDKGKKCCGTSVGGSVAARDSQECKLNDSTDQKGDPNATPQGVTPVQQDDQPVAWVGDTGPAPGTQAPRAVPRVASATAFPRTVPFRLFPFPTFFTGAPLPTGVPQCNNQLNPSMLVVNHLGASVVRENMCTGAVIATIRVPTRPLQVRVTPDGSQAIVTSYDNAISFIDTNTNAVTKSILTDGNTFPAGLAISPDGAYALVTNYIDVSPGLLVVDIPKQQITRTIPLDQVFPQSVFLNPDAALAWVTYPFQNVVEVIDITTGNINNALGVSTPFSVAFNATGTVAYIASESPGAVVVVDTKSYKVTATISTGGGASEMSLSPDGRILTVNNYFNNSVTVIDTVSFQATTYPLMGVPRGTATAPVQ